MLSNLRAARAINDERLATAARGHSTLRYGDRIPDWVTSNIIRLSATRRRDAGNHGRRWTRKAA